MTFTIDLTPRGVLLAGKWRTEAELNRMTKEDIRNTLIVELSGHTNQPGEYFQKFDDDTLVGKGATIVFLSKAQIRDRNALKNMSDDDERKTLIVENSHHSGLATSKLQGMTNHDLVKMGLEWFAKSLTSQWMKDHWETIKDKRLWQIAIPATHDSGCYAKRWMGVAGHAVLDYSERSQAQGATIYNQLAYGMRHFDLRFRKCGNGTYYIMHGWDVFETTLDIVLSDIKKFLSETEKEIIILQFRFETAGASDKEGAPVKGELGQKEVLAAIGENLILTHDDVTALGRVWPANCTPAGLIQRGKRVILLWDNTPDLDFKEAYKYIWSVDDTNKYMQITQPQNYGSAITTEELIDGRTRDLQWWRDNWRNIYFAHNGKYWFTLGANLTTAINLFEHGHGHDAQYNLQNLANESLPKVLEKLRGDWKNEPWNLVGADLFDERQYLDFANAVIDLNNNHFPYDIPDWQ